MWVLFENTSKTLQMSITKNVLMENNEHIDNLSNFKHNHTGVKIENCHASQQTLTMQ